MDVRFDNDKRVIENPQTRIYSPTKTGVSTPALEDSAMPVRPQPQKDAPAAKGKTRARLELTAMSKVLLILSVFLIALTALLGLSGAAQYAQIVSDTNNVKAEIASEEEKISQLKNDQNAMNRFSAIYEICQSYGMTMNWVNDALLDSVSPAATSSASPALTTPDPNNGD